MRSTFVFLFVFVVEVKERIGLPEVIHWIRKHIGERERESMCVQYTFSLLTTND